MENSKRIHTWAYSILAALLIFTIIWGFGKRKDVMAIQNEVNNNYNRAFSELVDYIDNIDVQLSKARLASSPSQLASIANDIFSESAQAKSCLGQLPTSQIQLENTSKFLSQVGDFTYMLSQDMINGEEISQEEYETLASLNEYADSLSDSLEDLQEKLMTGALSFNELYAKTSLNTVRADGPEILESMENVEKAFDEYPSLIYDGPFSEHIENMQPKMTEGKPEISRDEALKIAKEFLGKKGENLEFNSESENTALNSYNFGYNTAEDQVSVSVTKQGGYVLYFLDNTNVRDVNLDVASATQKAIEFLESRGIYDMVSSYYEKKNNVATINFAYSQNGITCYSDLIKVSVALDDGSIVGFESKGYLMNHIERTIDEPVLSQEEARQRVSTDLEVNATSLVLIPKDSLKEILCYEFKGSFNGKNFIVYVNALNGREEKILLLIESEEGILTI